MNISQSLRAFGRIYREDADFRRLGRPPGWFVLFHYLGRWYDRRGSAMPLREIRYSFRGRPLQFGMTEKYMGAFKGVFVDQEYDCSRLFPQPPRRILDLGGNIGFGCVFFSQLFPGTEIAVVEPDPRNTVLLKRNLERNNVRAAVFEGAIGATPGVLGLRIGSNPTCSSLQGTGLHELQDQVDVTVYTVPDIMNRLGWDEIDLVKIDIEGAEDELLASNNQWLARANSLIVEIHPNTSAKRLNRFLAPHGFTLERFGSGREPVYFARREQR